MIPGDHEVHLWGWSLEIGETERVAAWAQLDAEERARADRFHFAPDRTGYIAARAGLRMRLGRTLGRAGDDLVFAYGPFGKPALAGDTGPDLRFNLSHSGGLAVLAVATGFDLGLDVERMRPVEAERLAAATFAAPEAAIIRALPPGEREAAFFRCWTRKEAYVKALGRGFDLPLASFSVSLAPEQSAAVFAVEGDPDEPARWQMAHLDPCPGYVGALAARRTGWSIVIREQAPLTPGRDL